MLGGFHSPMEKEIFADLLRRKRPVIWCPAWSTERAAAAPMVAEALENNRILILEMRNCAGDLAAAEQRNRFIIEQSERLWLPYVAPGGMLERLVREVKSKGPPTDQRLDLNGNRPYAARSGILPAGPTSLVAPFRAKYGRGGGI